MHLIDGLLRSARVRPRAPAILNEGPPLDWGELASRIGRIAGGLSAAGLGPGSRIAVLALNGPAYLEAIHAIPWAGAVLVPLNTRLAEPELAFMLEEARAEALIFDPAHAEVAARLAASLPSLRHLWATGQVAGVAAWDDLAGGGALPDRHPAASDLLAICYTGGTTGRPKGVMLSHGGMEHHVACLMRDLEWAEDTRYLHVTPMFHLADLGPSYCLTALGGAHAFLPRFTVEALLQRLEILEITAVNLVPTLIGWLVGDPATPSRDLSRLRDIGYGSAPISEPVLRRALELFPGVTFRQFYGMTEVTASLSVLRPAHHDPSRPDQLRSAGQPTFGVQVRITGQDGAEVAPGAVGEIECRSAGLMLGYLDRPEETAAAITPDGWMRTGDLGRMDAEGFLHVVDRAKDMIVTGGENVFSSEVESAIASHPGVAQVAVIAVPSARWGEEVHAVVVPRPGTSLTGAEIIAHARARIAGYKCPKSVTIREDELPLSGGGKVQKHLLRAPFWEGRSRAVN
ncbi:MAG: AMP-binding protein [Rhodobacteraceae bacterium]|nr:AMP-binding protein [Paracoccaceae bacterium]